jgi:hypothetical protein
MHFVGHCRNAVAERRQRSPDLRGPHQNVISIVHRYLRETGSFPLANVGCEQHLRDRCCSAKHKKYKGTQNFGYDGLYPYDFHKVQQLLPGDNSIQLFSK